MKITNSMIDSELRKHGMVFRKTVKFNNEKSFFKAQKFYNKIRQKLKVKEINFEEKIIKTDDNENLRLCIYTNQERKNDAVGLLWFHGGGYAMGGPEQDFVFIKSFLDTANCVVVSPDYRLSIDAPYPSALNDGYATLLWMKENASELGIRDDQIFVGGSSAGGGLTAAITLLARDKREVNIAFQMPFYPMLDSKMNTKTSRDNDAPVWNSISNEVAWKLYLGGLWGNENIPTYASPAWETNFENLPPTYTFVGSIEPFCDETKEYINNLKLAGVEAELDIYNGCFHAFEVLCPKATVSKKAKEVYLKHFLYATKNYFACQNLSKTK